MPRLSGMNNPDDAEYAEYQAWGAGLGAEPDPDPEVGSSPVWSSARSNGK